MNLTTSKDCKGTINAALIIAASLWTFDNSFTVAVFLLQRHRITDSIKETCNCTLPKLHWSKKSIPGVQQAKSDLRFKTSFFRPIQF